MRGSTLRKPGVLVLDRVERVIDPLARCPAAKRPRAAPASARPRAPRTRSRRRTRRGPRGSRRAAPGPRRSRRWLGSRELGLELAAAQLERVGDVLQEQQAEHEVLVLGRLDAAAQLVRRLEQRRGVRSVPAADARHRLPSPRPTPLATKRTPYLRDGSSCSGVLSLAREFPRIATRVIRLPSTTRASCRGSPALGFRFYERIESICARARH